MSAKTEMLADLYRALARDPATAPPATPRPERGSDHTPALTPSELLSLLADRLRDYKADVHLAEGSDVADAVRAAVADARRIVVPAGLSSEIRAACEADGRTVTVDAEPKSLTPSELDQVDCVVTACRLAIAETGTIVLDASADQGRRAITLVPDHHVCVVRTDQIFHRVPDAWPHIDPGRPLTFISGPSATSDIEFNRVEGVHGPRRLDVVIVASTANSAA
jgi:L-lactate dehydrogenase complex protein LldG